ncbi:MAG: dihydroorotate dehydrogenase electron transfer subunit [Firmicutes bacterium]|nr:dihydroorotate dehydrogenase electron transfer subunit [Bacillota bacterium]
MLRENAGKLQVASIVKNEPLAHDVYHITLSAPKLAADARPGQFVMVKVAPGLEPALRRPFSLHRFDGEAGQVEFIYQVVGRGTDILTNRVAGEEIELFGPLGNGFCLEKGSRIGLVGGGMGIAPLLAAAEEISRLGREVVTFLGAKTGDYLLTTKDFAALGPLYLTTDDGSAGDKALVTKPLLDYLENKKLDLILACGPTPMLRALSKLANEGGIPTQLSLEERMGCGTGVCLGCATAIRADTPEGYTYKRVCHDGPVFWARDVLFSVPDKITAKGGCDHGQG